jgi:hypothetical protein
VELAGSEYSFANIAMCYSGATLVSTAVLLLGENLPSSRDDHVFPDSRGFAGALAFVVAGTGHIPDQQWRFEVIPVMAQNKV